MFKAIIFGLWETLGSKHFSASQTLKNHFDIRDNDFLERYEKSLHMKVWSNKEDMALSFLGEFNLDTNKENQNFVSSIILKGVKTSSKFDGIEELLASLEGFILILFSNTTNFESKVIQKWSLDHFFLKEFYPWKTGMLKPSKESFLNICNKLSLSPEECIFIDNEKRSITVASQLGFFPIKFSNVNNLEKELRVQKIITE